MSDSESLSARSAFNTKIRAFCLLLGLVLAAYGGNHFKLTLFYGIDLLFGSIAIFIIIHFYGVVWGASTAALASLYTLSAWGHPYAIIIFTLEALITGWLYRRGRFLVLVNGIYWILLGMPLVWLTYGLLLKLPSQAVVLILLKQSINGLFNALIASLIITYVPFEHWFLQRKSQFTHSFQQTLFTLLVAFLFFPSLGLMVIDSAQALNQIQGDVERSLNALSEQIVIRLESQKNHTLQTLKVLGEEWLKLEEPARMAELKPKLVLAHQLTPELQRLYVTDRIGRILLAYPAQETLKRPLLPTVERREILRQSELERLELLQQRDAPPILLQSWNLKQNGQTIGFVVGEISLDSWTKLLKAESSGENATAALLNAQDQVIASSQENQLLLQPLLAKQGVAIQKLGGNVYQWQPANTQLPTMARWRQSLYVSETQLEKNWMLVVAIPTTPYIALLEKSYASGLLVILLVTFSALLLASLVSYRLVKPLQTLMQVTTNLPDRLMQQETIDWPVSSVSEIRALVKNYKLMSRSLEQKFQEITTALANLNAIIENLGDALLVIDPQGRITRSNPAFFKLFQLNSQSLIGQECQTLLPQEIIHLVEQVQADPDEVVKAEVQLAGERVGKAVATAIQTNQTAPILGSVILIRDITVEKEIDHMKTDFISTVSHELRTPLTSVLGFASIIKEKLIEEILPALPHEDRKLLKAIQRVSTNVEIIISESERLTSLINDVLDIAKMEAGKVEWEMQPLYVEELLDHVESITSALFETSALTFQQQIEPNLPQVIGDRRRLMQVLINLISNAVKFTPVGSVTCSVKRQGNEIWISVQDTGIGISLDNQLKVFEKFKQAGDTLTDKPQGTGLGLPICKYIVEHHGGKIWLESQVGQGSTFTFSLPVSSPIQGIEPELNLEQFVQQLRNHLVTTTPIADTQRKSILVVDDDSCIRELLRQHLEAAGYEVREAQNGMEALQQVRQHRPDLITLDGLMPEISGFNVAAILKNDPQTADIPIIMLSIFDDQEQGYRLGIDRYLTKPLQTEDLLRNVNLLLAQGGSSKKVLVVDQNVSTFRNLATVLQAQGFQVTQVMNCRECIETALSVRPDMIILDACFLQDFELVKTLRFEKGLESICFLLVTDSQKEA